MNQYPYPSVQPLYVIRNTSNADILLPYQSLDPQPRHILHVGRCIMADKYTLDMIREYVEVLSEVAPVHQEEVKNDSWSATAEPNQKCTSGDNEDNEDDLFCFLTGWWNMYGSKFVRPGTLVPIAITSWPGAIEDQHKETHQGAIALSRIIRGIEEAPPKGWHVISRKRSHTTEFKLERLG